MSALDEIDPDNPASVDRSRLDPEEVIAAIRDRGQAHGRRRQAIAAAVEILAPQDGEEWAWDETDRRIVEALMSVGTSGAEEDGSLQHDAGDALGLAWIWRRQFDREGYLSLNSGARSAARDVISEENSDWIAIEQP